MPENFSQDLPANRSAPVVVGGTGGSGTRLLAALLRAAGVHLGTNVNRAEDTLAFRPFNRKWIVPYLQHREGQLHGLDGAAMAADFQTCLADHGADLPSHPRPWGWKRPETIYVLPFLHQQLPQVLFIHIVRDGLDMAFSSNQNDLLRYGHVLLGHGYDHEPEPLRSLRLWMKANTAAADFAERRLGPRYLRLHYEALCARPVETAAALFEFLGLKANPTLAASLVTDTGTRGRWRRQGDPELLFRLLQVGRPALQRFGYWEESSYREFSSRLGPGQRALLPLKSTASYLRHFGTRAARALRERRLLVALRNAFTPRASRR